MSHAIHAASHPMAGVYHCRHGCVEVIDCGTGLRIVQCRACGHWWSEVPMDLRLPLDWGAGL